jgi:uncharacterized membrane protein
MVIIAIVVGALLGLAAGDGLGALAGAVLAWLLLRSRQQQQQIDALQQTLDAWRSTAQNVPRAPAGIRAAPGDEEPSGNPQENPEPQRVEPAGMAALPPFHATPPRGPVPATLAAAAPAEDLPEDLWDTQPPQAWSAQPSRAASAAGSARSAASVSPQSGLFAGLKGWLWGGNTIVKLGVGILFIGLAFLAKYAAEHVSVPVETRLMGIGAVALVLLVLGWRLRASRPGYAQVLQGGAVAVLYLVLFAAFKLYGVIAAGPAFGLLVLVAALAAALAVLQDARSLAVMGALGGFATPVLVSTGSGNHVALFTYYLVLDLGIAAVAWHKTWRALNLVGFLGTFSVATVWGVLQYRAEHYATSQAFLIAYFLLFNAVLLMPARAGRTEPLPASRPDAWVNGSLLFGLPAISFALQHGLVRHLEYGSAVSALVLAGFYVLLARLMRQRPALATAFDASLAVAVVFLTLVIPFALDARSTAGAWALEGAGLVWLGWRQHRRLSRALGYLLQLLAGGAMVWSALAWRAPSQWLNGMAFNALLAAAGALVAAYVLHRARRGNFDAADETGHAVAPWMRGEALAAPLLLAWAVLWCGVAAAVEIENFVSHELRWAAWLVAVSVVALVFTALSRRFDWPAVAAPVVGHSLWMAVATLLLAEGNQVPLQHGGAWAWPVALLSHLAVLRWGVPQWPARSAALVHALGVLVLAGLGALQGSALSAGWGEPGSAWAWLGWLVVPAGLLVLLTRRPMAERWPVSAAPLAYQRDAGAVLALGLLGWTLLANVFSAGSAQPLPHLPLLNPLDLGVGVALVAVWAWARSAAAPSVLQDQAALLPSALGAAGFVWVNAILIRAFHHHGGVPFRLEAWLDSLAVQTGLTLLWSVIALGLMWFSARRLQRAPWVVGAVLLGAVVLKLVLVDLSGSGTVTRIVSFIGVGVLMLVIGFVAPLPSKEAPHEAA